MEEKVDWKQEAIHREAMPETLREPKTDIEFCNKHSIPHSTYYYEMSKDETKSEVLKLSLNLVKKKAPNILDKLGELAEKGDVKAIVAYLDYILQLSKNIDIKSGGEALPCLVEFINAKEENNTNTSGVSEAV